jgi:hypothetical protein
MARISGNMAKDSRDDFGVDCHQNLQMDFGTWMSQQTISVSKRLKGVLRFVRNARDSGHSCLLFSALECLSLLPIVPLSMNEALFYLNSSSPRFFPVFGVRSGKRSVAMTRPSNPTKEGFPGA